MSYTRVQLTGIAGAFADGTHLPAGLRVTVIVTDEATGQQGEARKSSASQRTTTPAPTRAHATAIESRDLSAVDRFAAAMRAKLRANDHKGHWSNCTPDWLLGRLRDEVRELVQEIQWPGTRDAAWVARVVSECCDVAAFAMMIADVVGGLPEVPTAAEQADGDGDRWLRRVKQVEARGEMAQLALRGDLEGLRAMLDRATKSTATPVAATSEAAVSPPRADGQSVVGGDGSAVGNEGSVAP